VKRVWYPGLPSHPDSELARRQMNGSGGMVTFSLGTKEKAFRFWDRLKLIARAASLGGPETLTSLPILFSHTGYSAEELRRAGSRRRDGADERGPRGSGRPDRRLATGAGMNGQARGDDARFPCAPPPPASRS